ncbi:hypothetical protein ACM26V_16025 [Salipaludibacillus sp. HK11]|uniref:hypothetical protein n=1 Tax=Salipaludibacillus sp. HK11 TaxID=3394320 RepID=UPI0039FCD124
MKKKLMVTALSSILALGFLGACGEVEDAPLDNDPGMNGVDGMENNGLNNGGMNNE